MRIVEKWFSSAQKKNWPGTAFLILLPMNMRPIPGYEGWFATEAGDIVSIRQGTRSWRERNFEPRKLKPRIQNSGYLYVATGKGRKSVHRLIALAWHGEPPSPNMECRHLNCCKLDNRPKNLRWGSTKANFKDSWRCGHGSIKLTPKLVREIRALIIQFAPYSAIARIYKVGYHTVYYIAEGMTWRTEAAGLTGEFRKWQRENDKKRLSEKQTSDRLRKQRKEEANT